MDERAKRAASADEVDEVTGVLDPEHLTPLASLNSLRLVDLPGLPLPAALRGRTGYQLLSSAALAEQVRAHAGALALAAVRDADPDTVLRRFDRCFAAGHPSVRAAAEALAARFGQRLGALLLTLRGGAAASRAARPEWGEGYWAHWAAVTTVHLGGGVVGGRLGPRLVAHTRRSLRQAGMTDCAVRRADWPALLPLIGAARSVPPGSRAALAFDCGQSFVKRACAVYADGHLARLHPLAPVPIRAVTAAIGDDPTAALVRDLGARLVAVMADTWQRARAAGWHPDPLLRVSIASYVRDGQPLPRRGGPYAPLHTLAPRLDQWLAARLQDRLGHPLEVGLLHDSSAAARAVPRDPHAAVIMLGTALGVGFPPAAPSLRPVAADFAVVGGGPGV